MVPDQNLSSLGIRANSSQKQNGRDYNELTLSNDGIGKITQSGT